MNLIWTSHALQRLKERGIKQGDACATWNRPDQSRYASSKGAWVYYKTYGDQMIEVVVKENDKGEPVVLSVWSKPVYSSNKPELFLNFLFRRLHAFIKR